MPSFAALDEEGDGVIRQKQGEAHRKPKDSGAHGTPTVKMNTAAGDSPLHSNGNGNGYGNVYGNGNSSWLGNTNGSNGTHGHESPSEAKAHLLLPKSDAPDGAEDDKILKEVAEKEMQTDRRWSNFKDALRNVLDNPGTEAFIIALILGNVVMMCISLEYITFDIFICSFFTLEMALRIIAMGLWAADDDSTYLADNANRLDAILTMAGWLQFVMPLNLSVLRVIRLLRLQKFEAFKGIRTIVTAIANSIPSLVDVCFLLLFSFTVYGIIGTSLYMGDLRNRCFVYEEQWDAATNSTIKVGNKDRISKPELYCAINLDEKQDSTPCPSNMVCMVAGNPWMGMASFDDVGASFLSIFVISTMEGWTDFMNPLMRSSASFAWVYFVSLLLFITFIVLNLFVAVVCTEYGKLRDDTGTEVQTDDYDADMDVSRYRIELDENGAWNRVRDNNTILTRTEAERERTFREKIQLQFVYIMNADWFDNLLMSCICLNTIFLAMPYAGMPGWYETMLLNMEDVFNVIFVLEVFINIIGCNGFWIYIGRGQSKFDFVVVALSLPDLFRLPLPSFSLFRAIRLVRLIRLLKSNVELMNLVDAVFLSLPAMGNLMIMISFTQLLFCLLGMQIFGGAVDDKHLRSNFNTFWQANLALFQCLTGENWTDILYSYMVGFPVFAPVYFLCWTVFGNYVLLNLFVAVITENVEMDESELKLKQEAEAKIKNAEERMFDGVAALGLITPDIDAALNMALLRANTVTKQETIVVPSLPLAYAPDVSVTYLNRLLDHKTKTMEYGVVWEHRNEPCSKGMARQRGIHQSLSELTKALSEDLVSTNETQSHGIFRVENSVAEAGGNAEAGLVEVKIKPRCSCTQAFFLFFWKETRASSRKIVQNPRFDNFILFTILLSSVALAMENPYITDTLKLVLAVGDFTWLIIFSFEFVAKIGAFGFQEYIADDWNRLDLLVLFFTYFSMFGPGDSAAGIGRIFRIGRTLRPLRMINRNPELKLIINSIIASLPSVSNALILACFTFFVFAVFGLNFFMGLLSQCSDTSLTKTECYGPMFEEDDEYLVPRKWVAQRGNFDSIVSSLLALFVAATTEGWIDLMYSTMDIDGPDMPPKFNNHIEYALYWVVFIFVCTFFIVQLFVGVIIDNYNRQMNVLTEEQKRWVLLKRIMMNMGPDPLLRPQHPWRLAVYKVVRSSAFDQLIILLVTVNTIVMAMAYYDQSASWDEMTSKINLFFVVVFAIEMVMKLIGFGPIQYCNDSWNIFDGIIATGSLVTMWFNVGTIAQVGRVFRIARLLKIVKRAKGLKTLFNTMITSLPSMANISSLMFLLFFVYAIIGITLFGSVRYGDTYNADANFRSFPVALLLLFRMSTGENWHIIMSECEITPPDCTNWGPQSDCGVKYIATVYYTSFYMVGVYLMLNLFIAVILDNFSNAYNKEANTITQEHLEQYRSLWRKYDLGGTGYIPLKLLRSLIERLDRHCNPLVNHLLSKRALYGIIHSDMKTEAGRALKGQTEQEIEEMGKVNFSKLCESLCVLQMELEMEGSYLTPDERAMMEDKQRTLRRDVAASVIASAIRRFLARLLYARMKAAKAEAELMLADDRRTPRKNARAASPRSTRSPRNKGLARGNAPGHIVGGIAAWRARHEFDTSRPQTSPDSATDRTGTSYGSPRTPKPYKV